MMAGHGAHIQGQEEREEDTSPAAISLPSLPRRLHANTWRQVFTSLRPLVVNTRQRTLSTYARRLHFRQQQRRSPTSEEIDSEEWQPLQGPIDANAESGSQDGSGRPQNSNVVIDMEGPRSSSPSRSFPNNNIPVPPLPPHSESAPSSSSSNSSTSALADVGNDSVITGDNVATNTEENAETNQQRSTSESISELLNQFPEIRSTLVVVWHYCIFLLIILAKALFDHFTGPPYVMSLVAFFVGFDSFFVLDLTNCELRKSLMPVAFPAMSHLLHGVLLWRYLRDLMSVTAFIFREESDGVSVMDRNWPILAYAAVIWINATNSRTLVAMLQKPSSHQSISKTIGEVQTRCQVLDCKRALFRWPPFFLKDLDVEKEIIAFFKQFYSKFTVCRPAEFGLKLKVFASSLFRFRTYSNYLISSCVAYDQGGLCFIHNPVPNFQHLGLCSYILLCTSVMCWFQH
ncbi:unnamed protein product, partial [Meganyctiphanes norvegica]